LGDFELRLANLIAITYTDVAVGESVHREVLTELPEREITSVQLSLPMSIGIELVDEYRPLFPSMPMKVALRIPLDVQSANQRRSFDRVFEDTGEERPVLPFHVLGPADVDRNQAGDLAHILLSRRYRLTGTGVGHLS
jgi:hypothetical protein